MSTFRHVAAALSSDSSQRPVRAGPLQRRIGGEVVLWFLLGFHGIVVWGFVRRASWSGERGWEFEKYEGGKKMGKADVGGVRAVSWRDAQKRKRRGWKWKAGVCMFGKTGREVLSRREKVVS
jgi:hypothetical protein